MDPGTTLIVKIWKQSACGRNPEKRIRMHFVQKGAELLDKLNNPPMGRDPEKRIRRHFVPNWIERLN